MAQTTSTSPDPWEILRRQAGGSGSEIYLAAFGNRLSSLGIRAADLGGKLKSFLDRHPDYCTISGVPGQEVVRFGSGPPPTTPRSAPIPAPSVNVERDLWKALVVNQPNRSSYIDLDTLSVITTESDDDGNPGTPVSDQPWRYLLVPTIPTDRQRGHAETALQGVLDPATLRDTREDSDWLAQLKGRLSNAEFEAFRAERREWVVGIVRPWLRRQGLPPGRFLWHRKARAPEPMSNLRRTIHIAIDKMTQDELERLLLPARLLVDKA